LKSYSSENAFSVMANAAQLTDTAVFPWHQVTIAPMMDITDRRFRYFMRQINSRVRLYTEMIVCHAIVRGDRQRLLEYDASQHPVVLQLGGDDPRLMAEAAAIAEGFGYDGIDINCGCPSTRVESGNFGVCLMRSPDLVAQIVAAVKKRVTMPVTVKCRIGITGEFSEETLARFAREVFAAGADSLTVHARTATIGGLLGMATMPGRAGSPRSRQNKTVRFPRCNTMLCISSKRACPAVCSRSTAASRRMPRFARTCRRSTG
jgi:hypothetical protein